MKNIRPQWTEHNMHYKNTDAQDALQWALDQLEQIKPKGARDQVERNYIHSLEMMRNQAVTHSGKNAHKTLSTR